MSDVNIGKRQANRNHYGSHNFPTKYINRKSVRRRWNVFCRVPIRISRVHCTHQQMKIIINERRWRRRHRRKGDWAKREEKINMEGERDEDDVCVRCASVCVCVHRAQSSLHTFLAAHSWLLFAPCAHRATILRWFLFLFAAKLMIAARWWQWYSREVRVKKK